LLAALRHSHIMTIYGMYYQQDNKVRQYVQAGLQRQHDYPELLSFNDRRTRPAPQSGAGGERRSVRHKSRWDGPRIAGVVGVSVDSFFRNVKRICESGHHQATGDNTNNERRDIGSD
jgi:hypothetical protein